MCISFAASSFQGKVRPSRPLGQPRCSATPACILFGIKRKHQVMSRLQLRVTEIKLMVGSRNFCKVSSSRLCSTTVHFIPTAVTCNEMQQSKVHCKSDSHTSTDRLAPFVSIQKTISCCKANSDCSRPFDLIVMHPSLSFTAAECAGQRLVHAVALSGPVSLSCLPSDQNGIYQASRSLSVQQLLLCLCLCF